MPSSHIQGAMESKTEIFYVLTCLNTLGNMMILLSASTQNTVCCSPDGQRTGQGGLSELTVYRAGQIWECTASYCE